LPTIRIVPSSIWTGGAPKVVPDSTIALYWRLPPLVPLSTI
jgi:hypothetical protein